MMSTAAAVVFRLGHQTNTAFALQQSQPTNPQPVFPSLNENKVCSSRAACVCKLVPGCLGARHAGCKRVHLPRGIRDQLEQTDVHTQTLAAAVNSQVGPLWNPPAPPEQRNF